MVNILIFDDKKDESASQFADKVYGTFDINAYSNVSMGKVNCEKTNNSVDTNSYAVRKVLEHFDDCLEMLIDSSENYDSKIAVAENVQSQIKEAINQLILNKRLRR